MLTREQILEINHYCAEHMMSLEARMDEIGVPHHQYYRWKKRHREEDVSGTGPEGGPFAQFTSEGAFAPPSSTRCSAVARRQISSPDLVGRSPYPLTYP